MTNSIEIISNPNKFESSNVLQYDNISSKYYLDHNINYNLQCLGNNIVLDGFNTSGTINNNICEFIISPGKAICDLTMIENKTPIIINFNVAPYDNGSIIILLSYKFTEDMYNKINIEIVYLSNYYLSKLSPKLEYIILAKYHIDKYSNILLKSDISFNTNEQIQLGGKKLDIYPISNILKTQLNTINKLEFLYNYGRI